MASQQAYHELGARELAQEARKVFGQIKGTLAPQGQHKILPLVALTDRVEYAVAGKPSDETKQFTQDFGPAAESFTTMPGEALAVAARSVWQQIKRELPVGQRTEAEPIISALADRVEYVSTGSPVGMQQQQ